MEYIDGGYSAYFKSLYADIVKQKLEVLGIKHMKDWYWVGYTDMVGGIYFDSEEDFIVFKMSMSEYILKSQYPTHYEYYGYDY